MYSIHGSIRGKKLPLLYSLLPNKDQKTYEELFRIVAQHVRRKPDYITIDFEKAAENAFNVIYPGCEILGCFFHFKKCIWKHICELHLKKEFLENQNNRRTMKNLAALAFVPPNNVVEEFGRIKENASDILDGINICIKEEAGVTLHQSCIVRWLSMINLLESVLQTFKTTKRLLLARNKQSLIHDLDVLTIKQLVLVLKPVKHVVTVVQTGNSPSLHLVLLCNLTLKRALSSYESLLDYVNTYCNQNDKPSNKWEHEENENYESEGIKWFRERLLLLIDELFNLDVRHYCATMLHPKYKLLKSCTIEERSQCHQYIRRQLNILHDTNLRHKSHEPSPEPQQKKIKIS
ncbi:unnamed protein product [Rotaria sp. Silwood1]|nr:unnamed protein product [Rotaria sp. Silwood1]